MKEGAARRLALPLALTLAAGGAALWWLAGGDARHAAGLRDEERVAMGTVESELPDGLLPPLLGPPRATSTPLCDEESWAGAAKLVREVNDGDIVVSEPDWRDMGASARGGVASWLSKCRAEGRPIRIRGSEKGELLATYDATTGYRASD